MKTQETRLAAAVAHTSHSLFKNVSR